MATTQELEGNLARPGAVATGRFTADGRLLEKRAKAAEVTDELAGVASQFAATTSMVLRTFSASYSQISGIPLVPFHGWIYSGGDMTSVIQNDVWTILRTKDSSFRERDAIGEKTLAGLLACHGVRFAAYYQPGGEIVAHAQSMPLSHDLRVTATQIVASVVGTVKGLAMAYSRLAKQPWTPFRVLIFSGGDWTVDASGTRWVLADAGECSVDEIYQALPW
jgi:roadblock/LC7 domain-containing protein